MHFLLRFGGFLNMHNNSSIKFSSLLSSNLNVKQIICVDSVGNKKENLARF